VLVHVYAGALGGPDVIAMVAEVNRELAGFLLATLDTRALFRRIVVRRGARLAGVMLRRALRRPAAIGRILETACYPSRASGDRLSDGEPSAELISIGLAPRYRERGTGRALIAALNQELTRRGVGAYTVSAYADNAQANALYERLGFELTHHFEMYGRRWKAYRFELSGGSRADLVTAARMPRG
jgi:ribosomal protein S18 acetylase RimI-like enzyme